MILDGYRVLVKRDVFCPMGDFLPLDIFDQHITRLIDRSAITDDVVAAVQILQNFERIAGDIVM